MQAFTDSLHQLAVARDAGDVAPEEISRHQRRLVEGFAGIFVAQSAADQAVRNKPVADEYVALFDKTFTQLAAGTTPDNAAPAYDHAAVAAATADRQKAVAACSDHSAEYKTNAARVECWIASATAYAKAIKQRDENLLDAQAVAMRAAAAAMDSGKLTQQQGGAALDAIALAENNRLLRQMPTIRRN